MKPLLIILGPTASGKTHLATRVADRIGGEIISADSRQVYRNMDIGTGKDLDEYILDGKQIPYHLIDVVNAGEKYNVNEYHKDFKNAYESITSRSNVPIVCGGTGFYMYSIMKGHAFSSIPVDEQLRADLGLMTHDDLMQKFLSFSTVYQSIADTTTRKRLIRAIEISKYLTDNPRLDHNIFQNSTEYQSVVFGLDPAVPLRRERISVRLKYRLENGLIEEVRDLLKSGLTADQLIYYGLEYKFVTMFISGEMNYVDMCQRLESEIHRFAKRQMTFFRKMEKDGIEINWLNTDISVSEQVEIITNKYQAIHS